MNAVVKIGAGVAAALVLAWWLWPTKTVEPAATAAGLAHAEESPSHEASLEAEPARTLLAPENRSIRESLEPQVGSPAVKEGATSLFVRVTWAEDGTPASGVAVKVIPWAAPDPFVYAEERTTGEEGTVLFENLSPGEVIVGCFLGGGSRPTIEAGRRFELAIVIPVGVRVEGEVVDARGLPVPDASIWLSSCMGGTDGMVAARSGEDGRFRLRSVRERCCVSARAPELAPSPAFPIEGKAGETAHVKIVIASTGGALEGVVRDPSGKPLEGAVVQSGREGTSSFQDQDGRTLSTPRAQRIRTDHEGRFAFAGVAPGRVPLAVRARRLAPWSGQAEIEAGRTTRLSIDLGPGAAIRGFVRDDRGDPVPDAFLGAGSYGDLLSNQTRSATDGSFRLEGLPGGEIEVRADGESRGKVRTKLVLLPGAEVQWDALLVRGGSVAGRVVDETGAPLANWMVGAVAADHPGLSYRSARTDTQGAFRLEGWPPEAKWIEVREPDSWTGDAAVVLRDIAIGTENLVVRVPRDARASAFVEGRVVGPDGRPVEGASILMFPGDGSTGFKEQPEASTGRFRIGPLKPGRYRFRFDAPRLGTIERLVRDLATDERLDVGVVELEVVGYVRVRLVAPAGTNPEQSVNCAIVNSEGRAVANVQIDGLEGLSEPLAAGAYIVRVRGASVGAEDQPVVVHSGEETPVDVPLQPATSRTLVIEGFDKLEAPTTVHLTVKDAAGGTVLDSEYRPGGNRPLRVRVTIMRPGAYRAEVSTSTGLTGSVSFDVPDFGPTRVPIELPLH